MKFNSFQIVQIPPDVIKINKREVIRLLGYENKKLESHFDKLVRENIKTAASLVKPRAGFIVKKICGTNRETGTIHLENESLEVGRIIFSQIKNAEYIALFLCTIGSKVELYSKELFHKGDNLEGYIVNLSGSEAAESAAEFVHREIAKLATDDRLKITNRFSPGYCKWNVKEQFKLFCFFPDNCCGISLTSSALMNPIKSVSGLIGIGKDVKFRGYSCSLCDDEHCIYRRKTQK
ncbi:MAG: hypothetical protein JXB24_13320 [Bacteroidales bacterium]|nr:hypothetical protein [Bacteroidales bacterium]